MYYISYYIFFFQAEDGIRDTSVTGVQTCALPISTPVSAADPPKRVLELVSEHTPVLGLRAAGELKAGDGIRRWEGKGRQARSEERRVGKECRCRGGP